MSSSRFWEYVTDIIDSEWMNSLPLTCSRLTMSGRVLCLGPFSYCPCVPIPTEASCILNREICTFEGDELHQINPLSKHLVSICHWLDGFCPTHKLTVSLGLHTTLVASSWPLDPLPHAPWPSLNILMLPSVHLSFPFILLSNSVDE